jgi:hypothetical protein
MITDIRFIYHSFPRCVRSQYAFDIAYSSPLGSENPASELRTFCSECWKMNMDMAMTTIVTPSATMSMAAIPTSTAAGAASTAVGMSMSMGDSGGCKLSVRISNLYHF